MRIIAVTNQKGGAGKTTTTVNLGACLASEGEKVLVVDLDPQANATMHFGIRDTEKSVCELFAGDLKGIIQDYDKENLGDKLGVIPSQINLASLETQLVDEMGREAILKRRLKRLPGDYDFILLDCPPSLGLFTINALTACHEVFIPVEAEYFALQAVRSLLGTLASVRDKLNDDLGEVRALLTKFDIRNNICHQIQASAREMFRENTFSTVIRKNVALVDAAAKGVPVIFCDPSARGSEDYRAMAREVLGKGRRP